jgi:hypothetical protein
MVKSCGKKDLGGIAPRKGFIYLDSVYVVDQFYNVHIFDLNGKHSQLQFELSKIFLGNDISFSQNGLYILRSSYGEYDSMGIVTLFNSFGTTLWEYKLNKEVPYISLSPEGSTIVVGVENKAKFMEVTNWTPIEMLYFKSSACPISQELEPLKDALKNYWSGKVKWVEYDFMRSEDRKKFEEYVVFNLPVAIVRYFNGSTEIMRDSISTKLNVTIADTLKMIKSLEQNGIKVPYFPEVKLVTEYETDSKISSILTTLDSLYTAVGSGYKVYFFEKHLEISFVKLNVKFKGEVVEVSEADTILTYVINISDVLEDPTGSLKAGMIAYVTFSKDFPNVEEVKVGGLVEVCGAFKGIEDNVVRISLEKTEHYLRKKIASWTVMVYLNGDNNLEGIALRIINEVERVGSTADVNIVALIDRHPKFDSSD